MEVLSCSVDSVFSHKVWHETELVKMRAWEHWKPSDEA